MRSRASIDRNWKEEGNFPYFQTFVDEHSFSDECLIFMTEMIGGLASMLSYMGDMFLTFLLLRGSTCKINDTHGSY